MKWKDWIYCLPCLHHLNICILSLLSIKYYEILNIMNNHFPNPLTWLTGDIQVSMGSIHEHKGFSSEKSLDYWITDS